MENNLRYFLVVAEELNISRAARKMFITQQSMSMHIKRLEEEMHTKLFNRKPHLSLTSEGEMLAETLHQIRILEENLSNRLNSGNQEYKGALNIGISHSRANILMPQIIPAYKKMWRNIDVVLQYDNTFENMENRLVRGYLDMFIGISQIDNSDNIEVVPLRNENLYIVISENLLKKFIFSQNPDCVKNVKNGADLSLFKDVPFILNTEGELSYKIYSRYFESNGIHLHSIISSDDSQLRTVLCANDLGAAIMVELMLMHVINYNKTTEKNPLYYFPVTGLTVPSILAYHKKKFLAEYARDFINIIAKESALYYKKLQM
ncbi:MAG: LysR family transcriptional regulator [Cloacibacillus porcorum]|uniref:LysR family transcriptional regulator n=1 Tax=Cloacibacillus porcorum TaxID=1197717 RepID=UPI0023F23B5C|nr:LysR family transcriptional regulator [Cloacibacillus porcorum]MCD7877402.1 LysR family transcriptional regulator [Cloacibacillus porcorum]